MRDKRASLVGSRRLRGLPEDLSNASTAAANAAAAVPAPVTTITCGDGATASSAAGDPNVLEHSHGVLLNRSGSGSTCDSSGGQDNDRGWEHRQAVFRRHPTHGNVSDSEVCLDLLGSSIAV